MDASVDAKHSVVRPLPSGANTVVFLQDACLNHQYIRSKDISNIVERPERVRAVKAGLAATISRLEELCASSSSSSSSAAPEPSDLDDLAQALNRMELENKSDVINIPLRVIHSSATVNILDNPAVKFVHGDIDGDVYLETLVEWVAKSQDKIAKGESEIPEGLSQTDLYLCPGSLQAISAALGTVCEAVDSVIQHARASASAPTATRAFCAIRPPGHHCGEDTPRGFCFVNNVAVGAAHAHLKHGINRVVILDIDLHHGNGTQSIAWQINEERYRRTLEDESRSSETPGLQVYYGSLHDILSFPCEDGKQELVQAASVSIHGPHGQYIENIHLLPYESQQDFFTRLYPGSYSNLLNKAQEFIENTPGTQDDVLVFISCGFDACEHEYPSMSRHNRRVPVEFYHRFTKDTRSFADRFAKGKIVSVLEGGYSNRALMSGTISHLSGLVDTDVEISQEWWSNENLDMLEKATKKRRGGRPSHTTKVPAPWAERTASLLGTMEAQNTSMKFTLPTAPMSMTLRGRKNNEESRDSGPVSTPGLKSSGAVKNETEISLASKRFPKVILKLGPPPGPT